MGQVIQYVSQPKKTMDEKGNRYLTGVNCVADVATQSFNGYACLAQQLFLHPNASFHGVHINYPVFD